MLGGSVVKDVVVLGGGTAGWITAALLKKALPEYVSITLVESEQIGTVGVGEATIPPIRELNQVLGVSEQEFLRETNGTIKLGIQFENWGAPGESYMHAFGGIGKNFPFCDFHHYWLRALQSGQAGGYWDYSLNFQAAAAGKFAPLKSIPGTNLPGLSYAYHFDAHLYAKYLRRIAESSGVRRVEGRVCKVRTSDQKSEIGSLLLESGQEIAGDLYIDCSGFAGILIDKALGVAFEGWEKWLPCDRAIAVPSSGVKPVPPFTRSIAHCAGWQWQIPLRHRTGNGMVFSSKYWSDDQALAALMENLPGEPLAEPKVIPFRTGCRAEQWHGNVVAVGLASGFLEPLESTSIHLVQTAVTRLIKYFPHNGIIEDDVQEFNRQSRSEIEAVRDFIILHYKLNRWRDGGFWQECEEMEIPDGLQRKIQVFLKSGKLTQEADGLFSDSAWIQVLIGQGILPADYHPVANSLSDKQLSSFLQSMKHLVQSTIERLPLHEEYIR